MTDVIDKSVTRRDAQDYKSGGILSVPGLWTGGYPGIVALPPPPLLGISAMNDAILASTVYHETTMWAPAIGKAISKQIALGWKVKDDAKSAQRLKRAQEMLHTSDGGAGWGPFLSRHLRSFLLRDNGAFVEVVRASSAAGSRVLGLVHLSSVRCRRTGDPDFPVIYTDRQGAEHALRSHQVLTFSDMPSDEDLYFQQGLCAAHRAYGAIYKVVCIETYFGEKTSGRRALAIHIVNGVTDQNLQDATADAEERTDNKGYVLFMGSIIVTTLVKDTPASVATIDLAGIPDGYDAKEEREKAYLSMANAIGMPLQDLQPLSGQGLGTGAQSIILAEEAEGQGLAAWRTEFEHALSQFVLPAATTFYFSTNDLRDQKAEAEVREIRAKTRKTMVETGEITPKESRQLAAQADDIPEEWLDQDATPENQLTDEEKPVDAAVQPAGVDLPPSATPAAAGLTPPALRAAVQRAIAKELRLKAGPEELDALLEQLRATIEALTAELASGAVTVDDWERALDRAIEAGHRSAYELGAGRVDPTSVAQMVDSQREYLQKFAAEISEKGWQPGYASRAEMYAQSAKASYWRGATAGLALPAWPGDGTTQCLTNCKCSWDVQTLEGDGNYDAYWRYGDAKHCQTCSERAADWAPFRIRGGEVVE